MNPLLKRGLAISAIAPLAFIAAIGSASAAATQNDFVTVGGANPNQVASCDFVGTNYDFDAAIAREGSSGTDDGFDIDAVAVLLQNNSQVTAKKVTIEYYNENRTAGQVIAGIVRPDYRDSVRPKNGVAFLKGDHDNIQFLKITALWKIDELQDNDDNDNDDEHDYETHQCMVTIA